MSNRPGLLFIISSPSGAGKTTLCRSLRTRFSELRFSVSYTTRSPRQGEVHGVDYYFVDTKAFMDMVEKRAFAEWAFVHGNRYGTTLESVRMALDLGQDVLFDVDYQGAESLRDQFPKEARLIYILPPSLDILAARLSARGTESQERVLQRLAKAKEELTHYRSYHYLVLNDQMDRAVAELSAIYQFERIKQLTDLISGQEIETMMQVARACSLAQRASLAEQLLSSDPSPSHHPH